MTGSHREPASALTGDENIDRLLLGVAKELIECSPMANKVYLALRQYADTRSPVAKTAAHLGIHRQTVYRAIDELCDAGLLIKPTGYVFPEMSQCDINAMRQCDRLVQAASSSEPPVSVGSASRPIGACRRHLVKRLRVRRLARTTGPQFADVGSRSRQYCLVQLKIARHSPRLLGFAM